MTVPAPRGPKRPHALSREHIVEAAIELLDAAGEAALTVRALTAYLGTGRGAIYHYISGKDELLAAATDGIICAVFESTADDSDPRRSLRMRALGIFDALVAHPWLGTQLGREPRQPAVLRIWKGIGTQLQRMAVVGDAGSNAGAALVNYILGAAAQYTATVHLASSGGDRKAYLDAFAADLIRDDSDSLIHETATALREHDDREQFLAGIDIFLAGIENTSAASGQ